VDLLKKQTNAAVSITITGWGGTWLEPGVEKPEKMVKFFNITLKKIGAERMRLRIDPVVPTEEGFARAKSVAEGIKEPVDVVTSLIQLYRRQEKVFYKLEVDLTRYSIKSGRARYPEKELAEKWLQILLCANSGFRGKVQFCGMPYEIYGAVHTGCVDEKLLRAIGVRDFRKIRPGKQRPGCKCVITKKQVIGGKCLHGCLYCYAHKENLSRFNP
jgi:hypothetical protein